VSQFSEELLSEEWVDNRVVFTTSVPIHILGVNAGSQIKLNYSWDDLAPMFEDFKRKITQIVIEDEEGQEEVLIFDGWIPVLEDIFREIE
jgi:hypothetical protein